MELKETGEAIQKESIKLMKMSKGYQWEIRIVSENERIEESDLKRLKQINKDISEEYEFKIPTE